MDGPRAGAFRLLHQLEVGGMGEVWRGEHVRSGLPVAIKLIRPDLVGEDRNRRDFEREMRWHARLDHPSIVYLYDHGNLEADAAARVGTPPGGPWLAMEYCSGSLKDIAAGLNWTGTRSVLLQLLGALGHAHAAGVLHRDIKIANVLVSDENDVRPGIKLADFGIAHVLGENDETTRSVGTPRYMAPEQVVGEWEDHGPWTDLYALGVLAWRLITGKRPYQGLYGSKLAMAMLNKPLGWPGSRYAIPPGVEEWIDRMTAKSPTDRFQLAADAAKALQALPEADSLGLWAPPKAMTLIPEETEEVPIPRAPVVQPMDDPPPETEANIRMHSAGLGLLALRRPALIGRRDERTKAWHLLRRVERTGTPALLSVLGPPRVGRTRFLEWLGETAERSGQGLSIVVRCVPGRDLGDQVVTAMRHWFRVGSRSMFETVEHLQSWLGDGAWLRDTAAMLVRSEAADQSWQTTIAGALAALSRRRPLVLRLEGTERADISGFVDAILALEKAPILVLLDRELGDVGDQLRLGPMTPASMQRLADAMVSLDPDVREKLVARAGGSPGFLVQTLNHWASRGLLKLGPGGFVVQASDGELPPTLAVVSSIRLNAVLDGASEAGMASLRRAAVIGPTVDAELWAALDADAPDASARESVLALLMRHGLAVDVPGGWRFTSVPFREAVLSQSPTRDDDHRRCADVLAARGQPGDDLAIGLHRLASGAVDDALEPLARGCQHVAEREGPGAGLAALEGLQRAVETLSGPSQLRWRAVMDQLEASFLANTAQFDRGRELADRALRTADLLGDAALAARCWAALGAVAARKRDVDTLTDCYAKALELGTDAPGDLRTVWWVALAKAQLARGDREGWKDHMASAARCAHGIANVEHIVPLGRAVEAQVAGRFDEALQHLVVAYNLAEAAGSGRGRLAVLRSRAHTLLDAGRLKAARGAFRQALDLAIQVRSRRAPAVLANAVSIEIRTERFAAATDLFERHRYLLPAGSDRGVELASLHCAAMAIAAGREDWRHVAYHLERVRDHESWSWFDRISNAQCLGFAVDRARIANRPELADAIVSTTQERMRAGDVQGPIE